MDRPIKKETIAFGVGGQFIRNDGFPELPPRARVHFEAWADFENIKHKFLEKGGVEETLILTIETSTFQVLDISEPPEEPEQGTLDTDDTDDAGETEDDRG